ncbi:iron uptake porin [Prochlorococcus sp. MIT 0801]|uniref:iron uptake porin n=1 Tax=Prochlorococcus sp. MIT 0801 TaxID=1501269 RepID=UPI00056EC579|nr:iron uptake porin [Prochlorococcus sp. MIT 0801]
MKLFQRLLVAPAALGLMAPLAANADVSGISKDSAPNIEVIQLQVDELKSRLSQLEDALDKATPEGSVKQEVIQARVDGVEAQLGEVMAGQFSSSTKMSGKAAFITGYVDDDNETDTDSITMEYMYQLNLNTSFTGEDNLYTRIKTGNVSDHFGDSRQGTYLSAANKNGGTLKVDKLWYQFPVGDSLQVWVGPRIENYYMLASAASIYKPITKQFANGPNGSSYGSSTSPGFGVAWTQEVDDPSAARWAVSANYTAKDGATSSGDKGMFGENTRSFWLTKIEYGSPQWQVSLATSFKEGADTYDGYYHTAAADVNADVTAYGLRAYWKPDTTGAIPEVQIGYESATIDNAAVGQAEDTDGWMVGFNWKDLFVDGNRAGVAIGSRQAASSIKGGTSDPSEDNTVWEAYYEFRVNDGVSVTPAIFGSTDVEAEGKDINGAVLLTEFRF